MPSDNSPRIKVESEEEEEVKMEVETAVKIEEETEVKMEMDTGVKSERSTASPFHAIKVEVGNHHHQLKREHSSPPPSRPNRDSCRRCNSSTHYNPVYCTEQSGDGRCRFCNTRGHIKRLCPQFAACGNKCLTFNYLFESPNTRRNCPERARGIRLRLAGAGAEKDVHKLFEGLESEIVPHFQLYELGDKCTYWKVEVKAGVNGEDLEWRLVTKTLCDKEVDKITIELNWA